MTAKPFALSVKARIRNEEGKVLLVRRSRRAKGNPGKWELPGGKVDPNEDIGRALEREVAEELGIVIEPIRVAGAAQSELPDRVVAYLVFDAHAISGIIRLSDEHSEAAWMSATEAGKADVVPYCRPFVSESA